MPERITTEDLEKTCALLTEVTGTTFGIRNAYGQFGLDKMQDGKPGRDVTPLMTRRQLWDVMGHMLNGAYAVKGTL